MRKKEDSLLSAQDTGVDREEEQAGKSGGEGEAARIGKKQATCHCCTAVLVKVRHMCCNRRATTIETTARTGPSYRYCYTPMREALDHLCFPALTHHTPSPCLFSALHPYCCTSHLYSTLGPYCSTGHVLCQPCSKSKTWSRGHLKGSLKLLPGMTPEQQARARPGGCEWDKQKEQRLRFAPSPQLCPDQLSPVIKKKVESLEVMPAPFPVLQAAAPAPRPAVWRPPPAHITRRSS